MWCQLWQGIAHHTQQTHPKAFSNEIVKVGVTNYTLEKCPQRHRLNHRRLVVCRLFFVALLICSYQRWCGEAQKWHHFQWIDKATNRTQFMGESESFDLCSANSVRVRLNCQNENSESEFVIIRTAIARGSASDFCCGSSRSTHRSTVSTKLEFSWRSVRPKRFLEN